MHDVENMPSNLCLSSIGLLLDGDELNGQQIEEGHENGQRPSSGAVLNNYYLFPFSLGESPIDRESAPPSFRS